MRGVDTVGLASTTHAVRSPVVTETEPFEAFFNREYPKMAALAAVTCGNPDSAEDLAQEALRRAHRRWAKIGTYDKPGAWLRRVTINLALSSRQRRQTELAAMVRLDRERPRHMPAAAASHDAVWDAVGTLPRNQRAAIALYYLEDLPVADIAEAIGCAESTARVHLHRGRQKLRGLLEGHLQ